MFSRLILSLVCILTCTSVTLAERVTRGNYVFDISRNVGDDGYHAIIIACVNGFNPTGELTIPGSVTVNGNTYPVTRVGIYGRSDGSLADPVYANLDGITSVVISNELETLSLNEFIGCPNIAEFKVKSKNAKYYAVNGVLFERDEYDTNFLVRYAPAKKATRYTIPSDVSMVREAAFADNKTLKNIVISGNQTMQNAWQLYNKSITNVDASQSTYYDRTLSKDGFLFYASQSTDNPFIALQSVCPGVKLDEYTVPSDVTQITAGAFCNSSIKKVNLNRASGFFETNLFRNSAIETIRIPASMSALILHNAFRDCASLTEVSVETHATGATEIASDAFYNCPNLQKVSFNSDLKELTIGDNAFRNCKSLVSFNLPIGTTIPLLGNYAFAGCKSLTFFPLSAVTRMEASMSSDRGCGQFADTGFTSIIWPSTLTSVPQECFKDCTSLTDIYFPESTETIYADAFYNTGIETLNTSGVGFIARGAFADCRNLRKVIIPANTKQPSFIAAFTFDVNGTQLIINTPLDPVSGSWETAKYSNVDVYCSVNDPAKIFLPYVVDGSNSPKTAWKSVNVPAHTIGQYSNYSGTTPREMFSYYNSPSNKTATVESLNPQVVITGVTIEGVKAVRNGNLWSAPSAMITNPKKMNVVIDYTVSGAEMQTTYNDVYSPGASDDISMDSAPTSIEWDGVQASFSDGCAWAVYNLQGISLISGRSNHADLSSLPSGIYIIRAGATAVKIRRD